MLIKYQKTKRRNVCGKRTNELKEEVKNVQNSSREEISYAAHQDKRLIRHIKVNLLVIFFYI